MRSAARGAVAVALVLLLLGGSGRRAIKAAKKKGRGGNVYIDPATGKRIAWGAEAERVSPGLLAAAREVARKMKIDPSLLLASWHVESGLMPWSHLNMWRDSSGKFHQQSYGTPDHIDSTTAGGGLFGLMRPTVEKNGMTMEGWLSLSAPEQAHWYYEIYKDWAGKLKDIDDVRLLGWGPKYARALVGKPADYPAFVRDSEETGDAYEANHTLDDDGDGVITKVDLVRHGRESLEQGMR